MTLGQNTSSQPLQCSKCGCARLKYKGVGEYECENCKSLEYDEYGKVRNYLEKHPGSNQSQVAQATGVPIHHIRQLLMDEKIEITPGSQVFMFCSNCGKEIRSGLYCEECKKKSTASVEKKGNGIKKGVFVSKNSQASDSGRRRYI